MNFKMEKEKVYIIESKNNFLSISFLLMVLGGLLIKSESFALAVKILLVCLLIYCFYWFLWYLTGKYELRFSREKLIVKKTIIGLKLRRKFDIKKIQNIKYLENSDSIFYWNFGGLLFPENNPMIIEFEYLGKKISIGKECKKFEVYEILNELKRQKNVP